MSQLKEIYTTQEWKQREEYYRNALIQMSIPASPTTKEVQLLISQLDTFMTEAQFDCAGIRRLHDRASLELKNAEAETFNIIKQQKILEGAKITEAETKGLVKTFLKTNLIAGYKSDIYTIMKATMDRLTYMEAVVKAVGEKKSSIISSLSILKLEAGLSPATKDVKLDYIEQ